MTKTDTGGEKFYYNNFEGVIIMKKLRQAIVALMLVATPLVVSPAVSAESTCENGFTGPDSNNLCTSVTTYECTVNNDNTVTIVNDNTQVAVSGDASGEGGAQSGSATNSNGVTFNVEVTNREQCSVVATVPATVTPTPTPTPPVKEEATPPATTKPAVLAPTSGNTTLAYVIGAVVALAVIAGIARIVTLSYSRSKL